MSGGTTEVHRDTEPLITGTHKGATDSVLTDTDFSNLRSFGVRAGLDIENVTKGATGTVAVERQEQPHRPDRLIGAILGHR